MHYTMLKKKHNFAVFALVIYIVSSTLTACGHLGNSDKNANPGNSNDALQGQTLLSSEENADYNHVSLPLTEEKETLTVWMVNDISTMDVCGEDLNNSPFFKELERRTNVHIEWIIPPAGTEQEQYNLLMTSGKLPDLMYTYAGVATYSKGVDAAVDDGYLLDLTDLLPQYAPHYLAALAACPEDVQKGVRTDSGRYVLMHTLLQEAQNPYYGYMVRQDWLDGLHLDVPETYDDWENMLTLFKSKLGATTPLCLNQMFFWDLGIGMGVYAPTDFYQVDGKVCNAFLDHPEEVREFLALMHDWYKKGLIDPDFATAASAAFWGDTLLITNNRTGAFLSMSMLVPNIYLPAMDEGTVFTAVKTPVKESGDELQYIAPVPIATFAYGVTTDCKNPELAVRWIDYLFSEEGAMFANYGVENETYTLDENGSPVFTDLILNNPDGLSFDAASRYYLLSPSYPASFYDPRRNDQGSSPEAITMDHLWGDVSCDIAYPLYVSMNAEESIEFSSLNADLSTYISENSLSFITGARSLDQFDDFIETLKGMGLERCVALKQAALDRFNRR